MHYLAPERPRLGGPNSLPLILGSPSRTVLPALYIAPRGDPDQNQIEISAFFPNKSGGASRKEITIPPEDFPAFWTKWLSDPELVAKDLFGWNPESPAASAPAPFDLDLDDLLKDF
jgi:hypothetical protein